MLPAGLVVASAAMLIGTLHSADAATTATWDRLAECESGGDWMANTGNGYYGGLQFAAQTWRDYGGTVYAPRPDLAARAQQITVAERLLAAAGWKPWPACSRRLHLTAADALGTPDVSPPAGVPLPTPVPTAAEPSPSPAPTASVGPLPSVSPVPSQSAAPAAPSVSPAPTPGQSAGAATGSANSAANRPPA